jgi:TPR repeat protein
LKGLFLCCFDEATFDRDVQMNAGDYWNEIYQLISKGEKIRALALCEQMPYSSVSNCQKYLGWEYYARSEWEKALSWFDKAADQGDAEAVFGRACIHMDRKDFKAAIVDFERAAGSGYARGYQWLGKIYYLGCGVPVDIDMAVHYYKQGSDHGYILAKRKLIDAQSQRANIFIKIILRLKFFKLLIQAAKIAARDPYDPCLADVPNFALKNSHE